MEEKLLTLENENHILRQKTLSVSPRSNRAGFVKPFLDVSSLHQPPPIIYCDLCKIIIDASRHTP